MTAEGVVVRSAPYLVASYADGQQEVVIPWAERADILAAKSPISFIRSASSTRPER